MKIILLSLIFYTLSFGQSFWWLGDDLSDEQVIANTYISRVVADGGAVIDEAAVLSAVESASGIYDSVYVWWEADFGVKKGAGDSASVLYDLKGNDFTQNDSMAIWTANQINGKPALVFEISSTVQKHYYGGLFAVSPSRLSVFIVIKIDADPPSLGASGLWRITSNTANSTHFPYTEGTIFNDFGSTARKTSVNPTPALTSYGIYEVRSASGEWTDWLDGTQLSTTETNTVGLDAPVILGKSNLTNWLDGDIAALIITNTFDHSTIRNYLSTKYSITIP